MLSHEDNETLVRIGADALMGQLMRLYWLPSSPRATSYHLESAYEGKSGMLMGVYPVRPPEWIGCLVTSSLSNATWINTGYNLLKLHT